MLSPTDGTLPEAWCAQYDGSPTLLPLWPASARMALVCVQPTGPGPEDTEAFVVVSPEQLKEVSNPDKTELTALFFRVPRSKLLEDPELCPGLTPESFWSPKE